MDSLHAYSTIAKSLRDFGYPDVTPKMVADTHVAMREGSELPHGVIGMFAKRQLDELIEAGALPK